MRILFADLCLVSGSAEEPWVTVKELGRIFKLNMNAVQKIRGKK